MASLRYVCVSCSFAVMAEQWQLCHVTVVTRVTISLGDLEISGNLSTAKKMPGNWPVVGEVSGNKSCRGKLFISLLAGTPMFNRWFRPCLAFVRILVLLSNWYTHTHLTAFFPGHLGKPVPERWNLSEFKWGKRWWGLGMAVAFS